MIGTLADVIRIALVAALAATCSPSPPVFTIPDISLECGPITDQALCFDAVEVAATAKVDNPPIEGVTIRRPDVSDECTTWLHPCGPEAIIVELEPLAGDTIQDVPLIRTSGGWMRLDLVR